MTMLFLIAMIAMPPLLPYHPLTPMQDGFNAAIQDGNNNQSFNAIDKCDQLDNASFYACSAGYYEGYRMMCSPCESNLAELAQNGINVR